MLKSSWIIGHVNPRLTSTHPALDLSANPLESLPDNIFEKLEDIKTLNVEGTKLRAIPTIPDQIRFNDLNMKNVPLFWLVI